MLSLSGCSRQDPKFHATTVASADFARLSVLGALVDATGRRPVSADFSGKAVVVFFGYAQCPDICPTTLATFKGVMERLGADADRVQILFVTLDPERDTPDVIGPYVGWFDPRFRALRGDAQSTQSVAREFRVQFSKSASGSAAGYSIDHSATAYAFDPQGNLRLLFRYGDSAENIAADLKALLADQ